MRKKTHSEYESELFEREIDFFPLEEYSGKDTPILHECLKGHIWKARPGHILKGHGCPDCAGNRRKTDAEYKQQLQGRPLLCVDTYQSDNKVALHKCLKCNHKWKATPSCVLRGTGCPMCNTGSFDKEKPGRVYHVSLEAGDLGRLYKIGITNNTVRERFKQDWNRLQMNLIWELEFEKGENAFHLEQLLKLENTFIKGVKILRGGGNSELLSYTIKKPATNSS